MLLLKLLDMDVKPLVLVPQLDVADLDESSVYVHFAAVKCWMREDRTGVDSVAGFKVQARTEHPAVQPGTTADALAGSHHAVDELRIGDRVCRIVITTLPRLLAYEGGDPLQQAPRLRLGQRPLDAPPHHPLNLGRHTGVSLLPPLQQSGQP